MPEGIWIALAIPTIVSVSGVVGFVAVVAWRDWRWRRREARRPAAVVVHLDPSRNGGTLRR